MAFDVGLIGYGLAGATFHAPLIHATEGLRLRAVMTSRAVDGVEVVDNQQALFDRVDLVVIASPNQSHFPLALAALKAGKHVVVDKPMAVTIAEADTLIEAARIAGRLLTVFHNRRWDGDYLTAKDMIASGRLGEVMLYQAHWDRFRPAIKPGWREAAGDGAGLLNDFGPHLLDQALQLSGWPDALSADIAEQRAAATVDDYFSVTLHYGAMRATVAASTLVTAPRPRFALYGTAGSFVKFGLDPQENALKAGVSPLAPGFGEDDVAHWSVFTDGSGASERVPTHPGRYLAFYAAIVEALRGGKPAPVDPVDARRGLALLEYARESSHTGRRIDLSA